MCPCGVRRHLLRFCEVCILLLLLDSLRVLNVVGERALVLAVDSVVGTFLALFVFHTGVVAREGGTGLKETRRRRIRKECGIVGGKDLGSVSYCVVSL